MSRVKLIGEGGSKPCKRLYDSEQVNGNDFAYHVRRLLTRSGEHGEPIKRLKVFNQCEQHVGTLTRHTPIITVHSMYDCITS